MESERVEAMIQSLRGGNVLRSGGVVSLLCYRSAARTGWGLHTAALSAAERASRWYFYHIIHEAADLKVLLDLWVSLLFVYVDFSFKQVYVLDGC